MNRTLATGAPPHGRGIAASVEQQLARERHISRTLQHAIQPTTAVVGDLEGVRVAVQYRGVDPALHVGGDWYLVQPLGNGDLVLAVGDVVGHGLDAVEAMIGLRYSMAAYAAEGHPPGVILSRLNGLLCRAADEAVATAVVATYRPRTGQIVWASAGHPPLLLAGRRRVLRLPIPRGPLLGVFPTAEFAQMTRRLTPGQSVLLYTDGVIGRGPLSEGIDLLADRIGGLRGQPERVLDQLDIGSGGDDACAVLAWRMA